MNQLKIVTNNGYKQNFDLSQVKHINKTNEGLKLQLSNGDTILVTNEQAYKLDIIKNGNTITQLTPESTLEEVKEAENTIYQGEISSDSWLSTHQTTVYTCGALGGIGALAIGLGGASSHKTITNNSGTQQKPTESNSTNSQESNSSNTQKPTESNSNNSQESNSSSAQKPTESNSNNSQESNSSNTQKPTESNSTNSQENNSSSAQKPTESNSNNSQENNSSSAQKPTESNSNNSQESNSSNTQKPTESNSNNSQESNSSSAQKPTESNSNNSQESNSSNTQKPTESNSTNSQENQNSENQDQSDLSNEDTDDETITYDEIKTLHIFHANLTIDGKTLFGMAKPKTSFKVLSEDGKIIKTVYVGTDGIFKVDLGSVHSSIKLDVKDSSNIWDNKVVTSEIDGISSIDSSTFAFFDVNSTTGGLNQSYVQSKIIGNLYNSFGDNHNTDQYTSMVQNGKYAITLNDQTLTLNANDKNIKTIEQQLSHGKLTVQSDGFFYYEASKETTSKIGTSNELQPLLNVKITDLETNKLVHSDTTRFDFHASKSILGSNEKDTFTVDGQGDDYSLWLGTNADTLVIKNSHQIKGYSQNDIFWEDFNINEGDKIDLHELLPEGLTEKNLADYISVNLSTSGKDTIIHIDTNNQHDKNVTYDSPHYVVSLENTKTSLDELLDHHALVY